jgi:AcrR family transcriptional regulator
MVRRYDSTRRKKAAGQTRNEILQAAMKLHWEGITEFGPLAREAGCSLPTLRKHFPTKEALFRDCTRTFTETLTMPDLEALGGIADPPRRLEESVSELCRIHEAMFGYAWHSAHLRSDSPTLDAVMSAYEGLADAITGIIAPAGSPKASVVRGLLDFLTYRALRLPGGLPPEKVREELIATLRPLVPGGE